MLQGDPMVADDWVFTDGGGSHNSTYCDKVTEYYPYFASAGSTFLYSQLIHADNTDGATKKLSQIFDSTGLENAMSSAYLHLVYNVPVKTGSPTAKLKWYGRNDPEGAWTLLNIYGSATEINLLSSSAPVEDRGDDWYVMRTNVYDKYINGGGIYDERNCLAF